MQHASSNLGNCQGTVSMSTKRQRGGSAACRRPSGCRHVLARLRRAAAAPAAPTRRRRRLWRRPHALSPCSRGSPHAWVRTCFVCAPVSRLEIAVRRWALGVELLLDLSKALALRV